MKPFGEALRFFRERRHFSQGQVAKLLGVPQSTLSTWESRTTAPNKPYQLQRLSEILEVPLEELEDGLVRKAASVAIDAESQWVQLAEMLAPTLPAEQALESIRLFDELPPELREQAFRYLRFLVEEAQLHVEREPEPEQGEEEGRGDGRAG